jgi:hypothetical protein
MIYSDKVEARLAADTNMFSCNIALKVVLVTYLQGLYIIPVLRYSE